MAKLVLSSEVSQLALLTSAESDISLQTIITADSSDYCAGLHNNLSTVSSR